ncbi:hypothetical protein Asi02nite_48680 [Asanoa siamensis]|uniref:MinD-like ATPase involved in chromosome partitioning or flagellar assembly n=2 Tax=Asanoa siamensis TaxID=926357 RepID=A0ABQ4CVP5_9ACTN|nr:hypothetical protein Asi02nite_48680 [Asanoa siamensis]
MPATANGDGNRVVPAQPVSPAGEQPGARQTAAVPMQRGGDGHVAGTPWSHPPQRPPHAESVHPAERHTGGYPVTPAPAPAPRTGAYPVTPPPATAPQDTSGYPTTPRPEPAQPDTAAYPPTPRPRAEPAQPDTAAYPPTPRPRPEPAQPDTAAYPVTPRPRHETAAADTGAYPVTPYPRHEPAPADASAHPRPEPDPADAGGYGEVGPGVVEVPQHGVYRMPAPATPPATANPRAEWPPDGAVPTADDFARRRAVRAPDPVATTGVRAVLNNASMGLVKLPPGAHERERRQEIDTVRRNFGGLRQVTVVNPKGGAGKTVAILLLAMTFGQKRGGYVLAWDNNETQGTLGMRAQQDFHNRTVRDLLRDLAQFRGAQGRVGDLSQYVRAQGEGMFDVLASDESATAGEMLTAAAFAHIRDVVSRFYKLIFVDTGNNVRAQNWQAAIDATDQLVVTMSARNDSAETAARMLDHLEQTGRHRLVRQAVTVVSMPPSRREIDLPPIQNHFAARTRAVLLAPYERLIDTGEPMRYASLSRETRDAWLKIAAAVAEGL